MPYLALFVLTLIISLFGITKAEKSVSALSVGLKWVSFIESELCVVILIILCILSFSLT